MCSNGKVGKSPFPATEHPFNFVGAQGAFHAVDPHYVLLGWKFHSGNRFNINQIGRVFVCLKDGHGSTWTVWQRPSCWCNWLPCWCPKMHPLKRFSVTSQPRRGGVETIWSQIWVCVESLKMRMLHYLWNMMDIGGMRKRKEWRKIWRKMQYCCSMHLWGPMWCA